MRQTRLIFSLFLLGCTHHAFAQSGSLDLNFGSNGYSTVLPEPILNKAYGIAEQSDKSILIAGYALSGPNNVFTLVELNPNGQQDLTFGLGGKVETLIGSDAFCYAIALQSDGKILLAGAAVNPSNSNKDFAVARYLSNGLPDSTFSGDGILMVSMASGDDVIRAIALQPDGKILFAGTATSGNESLLALMRLKPNGSLDPTFSGDGKATLGIGTFFTNAYAMALQSDGKIVVGGTAKFGMNDDLALARFLPNGTPDPAFGTAGHLSTELGSDVDAGNAVAIQPDGKILLAGTTGTSRDFMLARYTENGVLDANFGNQGIVTTDFSGSDDIANAILLQPDAKILLGGYAYVGTAPDFALIRYLSDGNLDPAFGTGGRVTADLGSGYDFGFPMIFQSDGKLLQGGYSFSNGHTAFAAARYLTGLNVGVLDEAKATQVLIAPNPIGTEALFSFENLEAGKFSLRLINTHGQELQRFFTDKYLEPGKQQERLFFSTGLASGCYWLRLEEAGKQSVNLKIFKKSGF